MSSIASLLPASAGQAGGESPECKERLDRIEGLFNSRRASRHTITNPPKGKKSYFDLYEPEATCLSEERFGNAAGKRHIAYGDGPKFVCGVDYLHSKSLIDDAGCLVYSVGSNNDISFEAAVKTNIGCEIHTFDPTLKIAFLGSEYAEFHPWGLGADDTVSKAKGTKFETASLKSFMRRLGHEGRKIDILKVDCEGCELQALPLIFDDIKNGTLDVDQILIEIHSHSASIVAKLERIFKAADDCGMRVAHKEMNHKGCGGYGCVEYVFVDSEYLRSVHRHLIC